MFRIRQPADLPAAIADASVVIGMVHFCEQTALLFGSDRREPTPYRPIILLRRDGPRMVVLPCTSKDRSGTPDFFELTEQRVMWSRRPNGHKSFASCHYEVIGGSHLQQKIGFMPQPARIELLDWLKSRC